MNNFGNAWPALMTSRSSPSALAHWPTCHAPILGLRGCPAQSKSGSCGKTGRCAITAGSGSHRGIYDQHSPIAAPPPAPTCAVDCPSVVVLGSRARPPTFSYACNVNLYAAVDCSPGGLRDGCPHAMICMEEISSESVAAAVRELVARRPTRPLPAETAFIP